MKITKTYETNRKKFSESGLFNARYLVFLKFLMLNEAFRNKNFLGLAISPYYGNS